MKRKNTTRNALLMSILSMLLCVSMLVGTTFAWFTDEVVSGTNLIAAGNLDVELYNSIGVDNDKKVDANTKLFDEITYWEPGVVAFENLTVANLGTLALKYQLSVNFTDATTNPQGETLAKVLKVGFVEGGIKSTTREGALTEVKKWQDLESFVQAGQLLPGETAPTTDVYGIVIYWQPSDIDNEFNMNNGNQGKVMSINLGVKLFATQLDAEYDSFGKDYDENLEPSASYVTSQEGLEEALLKGGKVILMNDITVEPETTDACVLPVGLLINSGKPVVLDLNGHNLVMEPDGNNQTALLFVHNTDVTIKGEGTLEQQGLDNSYTIWAKGTSTVSIESGKFVSNTADKKGIMLYASGNTAWDPNDDYATINVYGGEFISYSTGDPQYYANVMNHGVGKINYYGGTFNWNPATDVQADDRAHIKVADGYKVTEVDGLYYVTKDTAAVVSDAAKMAEAINNGTKEIVLTSGTYVIPAAAQGKELTIIGNGETNIAVTKVGTGGENCDYGLDGSTVVFENVTITTNSSTYIGYARCNGTYNNCTINGTYTLYGNSTFNNCTFNVSGDVYNIWTWGAPTATFNNCTFNSDGKAMLLYGTENTKLTLNDCTFNDNGGLTDLKAAVEIGNDYGKSYELIVNNTVVNGYEINNKGTFTGTTLWANKNSMSGENLKVVVDGVEVYGPSNTNAIYIDSAKGLVAFKDSMANGSNWKGKKVALVADIDLNGIEWNPTGAFAGTFDGNGHTISNLTIAGTSNVGFFKSLSTSAVVENVTFDKANISGEHYVGVVVGWEGNETTNAVIRNVTVQNSTITCDTDANNDNGDKAGAIVGYAVTITIEDCTVKNTSVKGYRDFGGILGYANGAKVIVRNNVVENVTLIIDNDVNYKNYTTDAEHDANPVVGEAAGAAKVENNTVK